MGEEGKQEEPSVEANPEEKKEEKQEDNSPEEQEEKKEESEPPPPPASLILSVNLHCAGCVKKIERTILKCRGVEGVEMDMGNDQVTVLGLVDPEALCSRIRKRTRKEVKVISPVLPPPVEGDPNSSQLVASQVGGVNTVELHVNMHCEACARQLRRTILKMRGVQTADTDLSSCKVTVTGTMGTESLVKYVYKCTKKQAQVMPQPPKEEDQTNKEEPEEPPEEEAEKKEQNKEQEETTEEVKLETAPEPQKGENPPEGGGTEEEKKDEDEGDSKEGDEAKPATLIGKEGEDEENVKKNMTYYWAPLYTIERLPPPQLFSDENPNACSIS